MHLTSSSTNNSGIISSTTTPSSANDATNLSISPTSGRHLLETGGLLNQNQQVRSGVTNHHPIVVPGSQRSISNRSVNQNSTNLGRGINSNVLSDTTNIREVTDPTATGGGTAPNSASSNALTEAYGKMTADILAERALGDFLSEHPGELVKTGSPQFVSSDYKIYFLNFIMNNFI